MDKAKLLKLTKEELIKEFNKISISEKNTNCTYCNDCNGCTNCIDCTACIDCTNCTACTNCNDCNGCTNCNHCNYCYMCKGISNQKHHILNVEVTEKEYISFMQRINKEREDG